MTTTMTKKEEGADDERGNDGREPLTGEAGNLLGENGCGLGGQASRA